MKHILLLLLGFLIFSPLEMNSQDVHFSQFCMTPLILNPALTGHIEGKYRINLNYKRQWTGVTRSGVFNTPALSFDLNLKTKKEKRHSFGLGLAAVNDLSSSNNKLTNLTVLLSGAGHFSLDKKEKHFISIGLNGGLMNRRFKTQDMLFASQYDGYTLDSDRSSGETFENTSFFNIDSRVGLVYAVYPSAKTHIKIGGSFLHVLKMDEGVSNVENARPHRIIANAEIFHSINPKIGIQPYFLFMTQAQAMEVAGGANIHFTFGFDNAFFVGGGYRWQDAAVATIGLDFKNMRLGMSYDVTTSKLGALTRGKGDFELSFQFIGLSKEDSEPILPALRYF